MRLLACRYHRHGGGFWPGFRSGRTARQGEFKTQFSWWYNATLGGPDFSDQIWEGFTAMQRVPMWFDFVVSDNLRATYAAKAGTSVVTESDQLVFKLQFVDHNLGVAEFYLGCPPPRRPPKKAAYP
ncbi:MAG: hypothetical protein EOM25_05115 [Deltaproteobacteria bacterium]|nr:hypothetical protein [Deltaproteobacteria bacterium]